jgi:hypothetical protein
MMAPISITIADAESAAASLTVTAMSSNAALVPTSGLVMSGDGATRNLTIAPAAGRSGTATITITVSDGTNATSTSFLVIIAGPAGARLRNLSARLMCRPDEGTLISGFVINGQATKRVLLRAVGPTLGTEPFDVPGALPDPRMVLKRWNGTAFVDVAGNDNWAANANASDIRQASASLLAFSLPDDSRDAVLLLDLEPGRYTVVTDDASGGGGVVILELYDAAATPDNSSFINLSIRGYVGAGAAVMISGFVVSGDAPQRLLVRAVGPALAAAPHIVSDTLSDPVIEIYRRNNDGTDTLVASHDNWGESGNGDSLAQQTSDLGAFALPAGSSDAAFTATFEPGVYTAVTRGAGGATGVALVEIYAIE